MRRELAARSAPATRGIGLWHSGWLRGLAGFAAVLLLVVMLGNVVAASRPGDFGYAMRAAAERAAARLSADMVTRSRAELRAAERRLADLDSYLELGGSSVSTAIASLLAADEAAMRAAVTLSEPERSVVAARIAAHGETLSRLAVRAGDPQTGEALRLAAQRASAFGLQLQPDPQPDRKPNLAPIETSAPAPTQRLTLTATAPPTDTHAATHPYDPAPGCYASCNRYPANDSSAEACCAPRPPQTPDVGRKPQVLLRPPDPKMGLQALNPVTATNRIQVLVAMILGLGKAVETAAPAKPADVGAIDPTTHLGGLRAPPRWCSLALFQHHAPCAEFLLWRCGAFQFDDRDPRDLIGVLCGQPTQD